MQFALAKYILTCHVQDLAQDAHAYKMCTPCQTLESQPFIILAKSHRTTSQLSFSKTYSKGVNATKKSTDLMQILKKLKHFPPKSAKHELKVLTAPMALFLTYSSAVS